LGLGVVPATDPILVLRKRSSRHAFVVYSRGQRIGFVQSADLDEEIGSARVCGKLERPVGWVPVSRCLDDERAGVGALALCQRDAIFLSEGVWVLAVAVLQRCLLGCLVDVDDG
jgi:hypothetical protein